VDSRQNREHEHAGDLPQGDERIVDATMAIVDEEATGPGGVGEKRPDEALVGEWLSQRNDVSALERYISGGLVVDTMEISGPWAALPGIYDATCAAIGGVEGTLAVSAHCIHSYLDGGCLYFTFAGQPVTASDGTSDPQATDAYYRAVWDAGTRAVLAGGGSLSHHHGVGLNRSRFVAEALGGSLDVLAAVKQTLDPQGILNPGKLGLASRFGPAQLP